MEERKGENSKRRIGRKEIISFMYEKREGKEREGNDTEMTVMEGNTRESGRVGGKER